MPYGVVHSDLVSFLLVLYSFGDSGWKYVHDIMELQLSYQYVCMLGADTIYERFDEERYGAVLAYHQTVLAPPCGCLNHLVRVSHQPLSLPHRTTRFIYDFISYPFGLYTTTVISGIVPSNASLNITFGWSVVIKCVPIHEIEPQWSDLPIPACFLCQGQSLAHSSSTILVPSTAR